MEHSYIIKNDIIDKYILYQLTAEQESELEEHLLFCEECSETYEKRRTVIAIIKNELPKEIMLREKISNKRKIISVKSFFFLKIAASVIIIFSLTRLCINLFSEKEQHNEAEIIEYKTEDSMVEKKTDSISENKIIKNREKQNNIQLAETFNPLPEFENFIKNPVRSENLKVLLPKLNSKFKINETIRIEWEFEAFDSLIFVVFDNKAKLIFEKRIASNYIFLQNLKPGLYYWQLETLEEALFTGKFSIWR